MVRTDRASENLDRQGRKYTVWRFFPTPSSPSTTHISRDNSHALHRPARVLPEFVRELLRDPTRPVLCPEPRPPLVGAELHPLLLPLHGQAVLGPHHGELAVPKVLADHAALRVEGVLLAIPHLQEGTALLRRPGVDVVVMEFLYHLLRRVRGVGHGHLD